MHCTCSNYLTDSRPVTLFGLFPASNTIFNELPRQALASSITTGILRVVSAW